LPCLDELPLPKLYMLVVGDGQVVIGLDFRSAVGVGAVVLLGQVLGVAVGFDAFVPFVADAVALGVLEVLMPFALAVDGALLRAGLVLATRVGEAVAAGAAQALAQAAGLVCRQLPGHRGSAVVQTAGAQCLVRVALQKPGPCF